MFVASPGMMRIAMNDIITITIDFIVVLPFVNAGYNKKTNKINEVEKTVGKIFKYLDEREKRDG